MNYTSLAGAWLLSAAFMAGGRTDTLIYGRYTEPFFVVAVAVGLGRAVTVGLRAREIALAAGLVVLAAAGFALQTDEHELTGSYNRSNVLALLALFRRSDPAIDWQAIAAYGVLLAVAIGALAVPRAPRATRLAAPALLAVLFVGIGADNARSMLQPRRATAAEAGGARRAGRRGDRVVRVGRRDQRPRRLIDRRRASCTVRAWQRSQRRTSSTSPAVP